MEGRIFATVAAVVVVVVGVCTRVGGFVAFGCFWVAVCVFAFAGFGFLLAVEGEAGG